MAGDQLACSMTGLVHINDQVDWHMCLLQLVDGLCCTLTYIDVHVSMHAVCKLFAQAHLPSCAAFLPVGACQYTIRLLRPA